MFTPIQQIIPKTAATLGMKRQLEAALVCEKYRKLAPRLVHTNALEYTSPISYRGKTLLIGVANSAWAQQVVDRAKDLLKEINRDLNTAKVAKIKTTCAPRAPYQGT